MTSRPISFNGRFAARPQSGVQRVARQLLYAIDRQLSNEQAADASDFDVLCPPQVDADNLPLTTMTLRRRGWGGGSQVWEQLELPVFAAGRLLVNLCNAAPLASRGGIVMMHDAQVYLTPESYRPAFVSWYRYAAPIIAARAAKVLTVSDYSRQMLAKYGVVSPDKVEVVHNGVDHIASTAPDCSILARLGAEPGRYAVAMANGQPHKNIQLLLRAFALPQLAGVRLILAGSAQPRHFGISAAPDNVIFAGAVSDGELRALMESAACFLFPSRTEGFGLPPLEAMAVGCPAVVAACGALPEVCGNAVDYADPDSPSAWAAAVLALVEAPAERERKSEAARRHASTYTWKRSAASVLGIIRAVAQR